MQTTFRGRGTVVQFDTITKESEIGRTDSTAVYVIHQPGIDRPLALKVCTNASPESAELFAVAARTMQGLQHPNICQVFAVGEDEGSPAYTMEYAAGGTLADRLAWGNPLPASETVSVGSQIADALDYAVHKGVPHGGLTAAQVMLDADGRVKVTDFAAAPSLDMTTIADHPMAPKLAPYMAPEQIRGNAVDERSDIYALGVLMYQMATGRLPFEAATPMAVAMKHWKDAPPDPCALNPALPRWLADLVLQCLAKEPSERLRDARSVADELRNRGGLPDAVGQCADAPQHTGRRIPWMRVLAIGGPVLVVSLALGAAAAIFVRPLPVPSVIGKTQEEAKDVLDKAPGPFTSAHFLVGNVTEEYDKNKKKGAIIRQNPVEQALTKRHSAIDLVVCTWDLRMPDCIGASDTDSRKKLSETGNLKVAEAEYRWHDEKGYGTIVAQWPEANAKVEAGDGVRLVLSAGQFPRSAIEALTRKWQDAYRAYNYDDLRACYWGSASIHAGGRDFDPEDYVKRLQELLIQSAGIPQVTYEGGMSVEPVKNTIHKAQVSFSCKKVTTVVNGPFPDMKAPYTTNTGVGDRTLTFEERNGVWKVADDTWDND